LEDFEELALKEGGEFEALPALSHAVAVANTVRKQGRRRTN
jgi:hypothetical protein